MRCKRWRPLLLVAATAAAFLQLLGCCGRAAAAAAVGDRAEGAGNRRPSRLSEGDAALGSPVEMAWQAWLLMDGTSSLGAEAGGARRIMPKSVFITPAWAPDALPPCADGHKRDAAGRCVRVVTINRDAQLSFLLQRLNALHSRPAPPAAAVGAGMGPLRVRLRTSPTSAPITTTSTTTTTTTPDPTEATDAEAPSTSPAPEVPEEETPPSVSIVVADMSKRSSADEPVTSTSSDKPPMFFGPTITVWTMENNTLHKSQDVDGSDSTFAVEIPSSSSSPSSTTTESTDGSSASPPVTVTVTASELQAPLSDVLDSSQGHDALPMLVISPGAPAAPTTSNPSTNDGQNKEAIASNITPPTPPLLEGSGDAGENQTMEEGGSLVTQEGGGGGERSDHEEDPKVFVKESEDDREVGSADLTEHIEVVPISEQTRHNLPLMEEEPSSQAGLASGIAGAVRPFPLDILRRRPPPATAPVLEDDDDEQEEEEEDGDDDDDDDDDDGGGGGDGDEPHRVHLFKGNYVKFPTDSAYRYKPGSVTDQYSDVKQTFWWAPDSWRIDQQRPHPTLQDFWSRMPSSEDALPYSQYNPTYHSPLPYQQRQAQYDPRWSSMRKQMTS